MEDTSDDLTLDLVISDMPCACKFKFKSREVSHRRKSHHEMENLKVEALKAASSSSSSSDRGGGSGDRLLPADFDTARPRPNIVLIMCDDQGRGKVEL